MGVKNFIENNRKNPWHWFLALSNRKMADWLPDRLFLHLKYRAMLGEKLNLKHPITFNEKLQWIKLYDHNPLYTILVDKYLVKNYVAQAIGNQYVIPTIGVWDNFDDIDFNSLPNKFVLKCTHDSGSTIICRDKETFDIVAAGRKIEKLLKTDFYLLSMEWPYKNVKPRILIEDLLEDNVGNQISFDESIFPENPGIVELDGFEDALYYSLFCYKGKVVCYRWKQKDRNSCLYNRNHEVISGTLLDNMTEVGSKNVIDDLIAVAEKLAEGHLLMYVGLYFYKDKVFFGRISIPDMKSTDDFELYKWLDINSSECKTNEKKCILNLFPDIKSDEKQKYEAIIDYKIFCFGGKVDNIMIVEDRASGVPKFFHFSKKWELLDYNRMGRILPKNAMIKKPELMEEMIRLAERLSAGLPEVRIDFYEVNGKIYFGEYTFFHEGGYEGGFDYETNKHMGELIKLPVKFI